LDLTGSRFNHSASGTYTHQPAKFRQKWTMHSIVIDDSTNFRGLFFKERYVLTLSPQSWGTYIKFGEDIGTSLTLSILDELKTV